ncbi:Single-stranded DNA-binding protein [Candidatus Johnevansia muelleri]|uniref:Single-stranded DNA-binding protein n=1 Tax=Candidatus Johnevansia muelleri TaxID=1495769 RepID=A0A078KHX1_9GAMM|nr:Single-stranded DNA-binding protein [Candidatus Evansia muelleri]
MVIGINKVILIGYIGNDPKIRYLPSGNTVCNISIATKNRWKTPNGQRQERTDWHSVVIFNKLSEIVQQYVKKGSLLYIEGYLKTKKWQSSDGKNRYSTDIIANEIQILIFKETNTPEPTPVKINNNEKYKLNNINTNYDDFDDEITF